VVGLVLWGSVPSDVTAPEEPTGRQLGEYDLGSGSATAISLANVRLGIGKTGEQLLHEGVSTRGGNRGKRLLGGEVPRGTDVAT